MHPDLLYQELNARCSRFITSYRDDLEKHDRNTLAENPGVPFLHWSRDYGTDLLLFRGADRFPARGEEVPYLFGHAKREHILDQFKEIAEYRTLQSCCRLILHYNGRKLAEVTSKHALILVDQYRERIRREWQRAEAPQSSYLQAVRALAACPA